MAQKTRRTKTPRKGMLAQLNKPAVLIVTALLLVAIVAVIVFLRKPEPTNSPSVPVPAGSGQSKINYGPPTTAQKQDSDQHKQAIVAQQDAQKNPSTEASIITPIITYNHQNEDGSLSVYAYVQGVAEDGGTCTLTASKGASSFSVDNPAIMNVSTTSCKNFSIPRSSFSSSGTWTINVTYKSATSSGASQAQEKEIN